MAIAENRELLVSVIRNVPLRDDPNAPFLLPSFLIKAHVTLSHCTSSDSNVNVKDESFDTQLPCVLLTGDKGVPGTVSWHLVSGILEQAGINDFDPSCIRVGIEGSETKLTLLEDKQALVASLLDTLRSAAASATVSSPQNIPIICFKKRVMLAPNESEAKATEEKNRKREKLLVMMMRTTARESISLRWSNSELVAKVREMVCQSAKAGEYRGHCNKKQISRMTRMALEERARLLMKKTARRVWMRNCKKECPICLSGFMLGATAYTTKQCACAHVYFHSVCLEKWLRRKDSCPTCQTSVLNQPKKM